MSIYELTDANGKRLRIVPGRGSILCNEANLFGNPFAARAFVEALAPDTRMAISRLFMDAFRDQPRHINAPLDAPSFGGPCDPNKALLTSDAKLTRAIANSELVVQLDDSLQPVDDNRAELRMKIRMQLNTLLADERREAAMYQAQMDKESTFTKGLIYTGAFFHGLGNAAWDTLKWAKEVSDLGNPLVQMRNMFNAAYDAYGEDRAVEAFAKNLQAAHWRELVEALGFDPSQISREMIAQAMDAANVIWDDETLRQDLTTFAKDYIKAQHAVELTNMGGGAALEVVITAILAALTAGAGLAIATAAKARHLPNLRKLGDLLLEFAEQSKKLARYLKEKAQRAAKGKPDKPLDAEPVVERVNEPPRGETGSGSDRKTSDFEPETLYRRDSRPPETIFEEGFQARRPDANVPLEDYVDFNVPSQYVGTSKVFDGASQVNTQKGQAGYLYEIRNPGGGIDVNKVYPDGPFPEEQEMAFVGGIDSCNIKGCTPLDSDNNAIGEYISNPRYTGGD
ncbi:scabin-related ADP-ribosyltransferase [Simiduia agarivorans]|uniref:Pierisin-like domain-containing protein n=1 Tax=Simiduia agarivorans (strain DSM 21679 / JCM 13881 / BCRC 17597 / SA1) TaxID=1117647 RepID=K4KMF8_SIMAS|nr:hypothetical protein [Simiduia agarivorans]AFV00187.1 hypothetical protein M5M_15270 [Simiduia agarivorans SA1 = DSM 21679]